MIVVGLFCRFAFAFSLTLNDDFSARHYVLQFGIFFGNESTKRYCVNVEDIFFAVSATVAVKRRKKIIRQKIGNV